MRTAALCWCLSLSLALSMAARAQFSRLRRPEAVDSQPQMSDYLKELQEYYSVHGRGRFGKRQMHIADASITYKEVPIFEKTNGDTFWKTLSSKF